MKKCLSSSKGIHWTEIDKVYGVFRGNDALSFHLTPEIAKREIGKRKGLVVKEVSIVEWNDRPGTTWDRLKSIIDEWL